MSASSIEPGHARSRSAPDLGEIRLRLPNDPPELNRDAAIALLRLLRKAAACQQITRDTPTDLDSQAGST
jgi:hypothetical protein